MFWKIIKDKGLTDYHTLTILRAIAFVSISLSLLFLLTMYLKSFITAQIYIVYAIIAVFSAILAISYATNSAFKTALAFSFLTPFWYSLGTLITGIGIEAGTCAMVNIAVAFAFYDRKPKVNIIAILWGIMIFIGSLAYVEIYGPIFEEAIPIPLFRITVISVCSGIIASVILLYSRQNRTLIKDLKANNKILKEVKNELESFSYMASHDLQGPLRNINGFINLAERRINDGNISEAKEFLHMSKEGSSKLSELLTDMLAISRIGKVKLKEVVDLHTVLADVREQLYTEFPNAIIKSDVLPHYECNRTEFFLLFSNLIKNGIKYNESKIPSVDVSFKIGSKCIELVISDNGIGIEEEEQKNIFNFFHRTNKMHTDGSGLGLGICKKIVDVYQGELSIDSTLGKGSSFKIKLPIKGVQLKKLPLKVQDEVKLSPSFS